MRRVFAFLSCNLAKIHYESDVMNISDSTDFSSEENTPSESTDNAANEGELSLDQKREIAHWIADGMGLSDVQKRINQDFGVVMTYMDVRFLVDDLDLTLVDKEVEKPKEPSPEGTEGDDPDSNSLDPNATEAPSGVSVEVDPVTPPGAMAGGSVTFSDGQHKKWTLDQFGRLGLSGGDEGYKPSDEDVMEFQKQLDSALRGKGF